MIQKTIIIWVGFLWVVFQIILVSIWMNTGSHMDLDTVPSIAKKLGITVSIDELNGRLQGQSVTTYGKVTKISDHDSIIEFLLVDIKSNSTISCEISKDSVNENKEREEVIVDSEKSGSGIYVNGIYRLGLLNRKIDVRKVFTP